MNDEPCTQCMSRIIVGYDERASGRDALHLGQVLAAATGADLLLASVFPYSQAGMGEGAFEQALREDCDRIFTPVLDELEAGVETVGVGNRSPAEAIEELAAERDADLIVVGSSHRGTIGRILPGSTALQLLSETRCPVAVAPKGFAGSRSDDSMRVIAVAYDGGQQSDAALLIAAELAMRESAALRLITVNPPPHGYAIAAYDPRMRDSYRVAMDAAVARTSSRIRPLGLFLDGDPATKILEQAELGVDLLVMGSHGKGPFTRVALGSVSARVLAGAKCPVLMVPTGFVSRPEQPTASMAEA